MNGTFKVLRLLMQRTFNERKPISRKELQNRTGQKNASARITQIRKHGVKVSKFWKRDKSGNRYAIYFIPITHLKQAVIAYKTLR